MSRVLVLIGSARKGGNTDLLARAFADGAGRRHQVELVPAGELTIRPCTGCGVCFENADGRCAQQDDMQGIYQKLQWTDTLVIASPVYFYGVSAQLKAMVDRLHTPMRKSFRVQRLGLILAGAAALPDLFDPILLQYRMILRFFDLEDIGTVLVPGVREKGDVLQTDGPRRAYALGAGLE